MTALIQDLQTMTDEQIADTMRMAGRLLANLISFIGTEEKIRDQANVVLVCADILKIRKEARQGN